MISDARELAKHGRLIVKGLVVANHNEENYNGCQLDEMTSYVWQNGSLIAREPSLPSLGPKGT